METPVNNIKEDPERAEEYRFKAEIKQLLHILAHSLYKDRDIFLRELISNASDALTRMHFESLTNRDVLDVDASLEIHVEAPGVEESARKKIVVRDSGIGMDRDEIIQNLGTIAQSGAREFLARAGDEDFDSSDVIGQFGVGFYSVFMVADEVRVVSRSYKPDAAAVSWTSHGGDEFRVDEAEKGDRGTEIHIYLKKDSEEFANAWRLKQIVKKYSDFVRYPIFVGDEQANQQTSLWRKRPSTVESDEYKQFYQQMTMDFEEPLAITHFASDAPVHLRALLFIPAKREPGILASRKEPGVMLYSHNVLIQEYCTDLLPPWLGFVDGVVDSEDLPLNVSRETVQQSRIMRQLARTVRKRVLKDLGSLAKNEPEKYTAFWNEFGRVFKEGLATDPAAKDEILPFLRYFSSNDEEQLTSLEEYVERMPDSQEEIYFVLGDDVQSASRSPHLDPLKAQDLEVLYWVDPLDAFLAPILTEYEGKQLRNVDDAGLELPETEEQTPEDETEPILDEKPFNQFVGRCVTVLGDRIIEVRESKVLKNSPVRLLSPENAEGRDMQRLQRYLDQNYEVPKKILELNRKHPLIVNLAHLLETQPESELIDLSINQLYESALVQEGLHPNPLQMLPRIEELMLLASAGAKEKAD
ncbi:MAG: molecular chaperone HtpG [Candidatus Promineifilaceae bacterium]|nr:molecular chaperone HtpG [Candidatus Promineifilaceae bacterium]